MTSLPKLILASTSPYRKELIEQLNVPFTCESPDIDEKSDQYNHLSAVELSQILAFAKADDIYNKNQDSFVIGGDQVLAFKNEIFGKPGTEEKAIEQLLKLNSNTHQLVTSICILGPATKIEFTNIARMTMKKLTKSQIESYIKKDQPLNCCGSYKLESLGKDLFEKIECDDQSAIIGVPLIQLGKELAKIGFSIS